MLLQKLAMPFPALKATIVLPDFARSLPADGKILYLSCHRWGLEAWRVGLCARPFDRLGVKGPLLPFLLQSSMVLTYLIVIQRCINPRLQINFKSIIQFQFILQRILK
jgi:hypothetical protein